MSKMKAEENLELVLPEKPFDGISDRFHDIFICHYDKVHSILRYRIKKNQLDLTDISFNEKNKLISAISALFSAWQLFNHLLRYCNIDPFGLCKIEESGDETYIIYYKNKIQYDKYVKKALEAYNEMRKDLAPFSANLTKIAPICWYNGLFRVRFKAKQMKSEKRIKHLLETQCKKCGHIWIKRSLNDPAVCPKCKRHDWQKSRLDGKYG